MAHRTPSTTMVDLRLLVGMYHRLVIFMGGRHSKAQERLSPRSKQVLRASVLAAPVSAGVILTGANSAFASLGPEIRTVQPSITSEQSGVGHPVITYRYSPRVPQGLQSVFLNSFNTMSGDLNSVGNTRGSWYRPAETDAKPDLHVDYNEKAFDGEPSGIAANTQTFESGRSVVNVRPSWLNGDNGGGQTPSEDAQTHVVMHELGHVNGLGHSTGGSNENYPGEPNEMMRSIGAPDSEGKWLTHLSPNEAQSAWGNLTSSADGAGAPADRAAPSAYQNPSQTSQQPAYGSDGGTVTEYASPWYGAEPGAWQEFRADGEGVTQGLGQGYQDQVDWSRGGQDQVPVEDYQGQAPEYPDYQAEAVPDYPAYQAEAVPDYEAYQTEAVPEYQGEAPEYQGYAVVAAPDYQESAQDQGVVYADDSRAGYTGW
ncbi:hypothetical protein OG389_00915 [Streptomyces sp. NBC_00435]|uniref:hypothetical protein n=1 Tax=Streptomyces sp. NBC_00435 TaxID=2903649 RepID=UPI002E1BFD48